MADTVQVNVEEMPSENGVPPKDFSDFDSRVSSADSEAPYGRFGNGNPRKSPPKNGDGTAPKRGRPRKIQTVPKDAQYYAKKLEPMIGGLAMVASGFSPIDGIIIQQSATPLAMGWGKVAEVDPRVAKIIDGGGTASVWMEAILPTVMVALMIGAAHNMLPPALDNMVRVQVNEAEKMVKAMQREQRMRQAEKEQNGYADAV